MHGAVVGRREEEEEGAGGQRRICDTRQEDGGVLPLQKKGEKEGRRLCLEGQKGTLCKWHRRVELFVWKRKRCNLLTFLFGCSSCWCRDLTSRSSVRYCSTGSKEKKERMK